MYILYYIYKYINIIEKYIYKAKLYGEKACFNKFLYI